MSFDVPGGDSTFARTSTLQARQCPSPDLVRRRPLSVPSLSLDFHCVLVKMLTGKVAVVSGVSTPLAALLCLKLVRRGARLLLIDDTTAEPCARDMNLLWAGLDVNYVRENGTDLWGTQPIALPFARNRDGHRGKEIVESCLEFFGKRPDVVVDVERSIELQDLQEIFPLLPHHCRFCLQSVDPDSLESEHWPEGSHRENVNPATKCQTLSLFGTCSVELLETLSPQPKWRELCQNVCLLPSASAMLCRTDDPIQFLTYVFHAGTLSQADEFKVLLNDVTDAGDCSCGLRMENVALASLCKQVSTVENLSGAVTPCPSTPLELEASNGCMSSSPSDLFNNSNATFDAILQKSKDYPIDWCEGGSESFIAMDDINFKVMTRAVINYTVRWLVLGYLVIGFAVPKALGWDGP